MGTYVVLLGSGYTLGTKVDFEEAEAGDPEGEGTAD